MSNELIKIEYNSHLGRGSFLVNPDTENVEFIQFCVETLKSYDLIIVELNEGYESRSGIYREASDERKFEKIFLVRKAYKDTPPLLALTSLLGNGKEGLVTDKNAIASYRLANPEDELYKELKLVENLFEMDLFEFMDMYKDEDGNLTEEYLRYSNLINKVFR